MRKFRVFTKILQSASRYFNDNLAISTEVPMKCTIKLI